MHTTQQLHEHADMLERANVHDDMGLSILLSQAADLLRWAAERTAGVGPTEALRELAAQLRHEASSDPMDDHAACVLYRCAARIDAALSGRPTKEL